MQLKSIFLASLISLLVHVPLVGIGVSASGLLLSANANAQESELRTRRVPTLRARVFEQLSRAQTASEAGNTQEALSLLDEVKAKMDSMNAYEIATMYNFYGFIYYEQEDFDKTIESFELAIAQDPIPEGFEQTALYSLAQLNMVQGEYAKVIAYLNRWEALQRGAIPPKNKVLKAQALYQNKQYEDAAELLETAILEHEAEGYVADENWLILQRAVYFELKQPEKVKDVIAKLIRLYDAPKYWIQLAGMYGELERNAEQLAIMEVAYQQGFVSSASDTFMLAQLYYFNGAPYKAGLLMDQALESGVLEENLRNTQFLAQSWQAAKENEKAIDAFARATEFAVNGDLDAQLALLYYNTDQYDKAIVHANAANEKGELRNPGNNYMVLGLAHYSKREFASAIDILAKAEEFAPSRASARQWRNFVEREKTTYEQRLALEAGQ